MAARKPRAADGTSRPKASANVAPLEAGASRRRLATFRPATAHINSLIAQVGPTTAARARWLVRNNTYSKNAHSKWKSKTVRSGIKPSSLIEDPVLKRQVQRLWLRWTDEADADGLTDFYGLQARGAGDEFVDGEAFFRIRYRRAEDGLSVPMQIQAIPANQCPLDLNRTEPNGNVIRQGIEFNRIGRRVAFWFYRTNPADSTEEKANAADLVRIPADDIIHLFDPQEPGQIRGLSRLSSAITKLFLLDQYDDAELDRKKTAALYAGFIKTDTPEDFDPNANVDEDGAAPLNLQPGTMQVLLPGEDIVFSEPADVGGSYEAFQYRTLLAVAAGVGLPYSDLIGDQLKASYSNTRAGMITFREAVEAYQHNILVFQFCRRVWNAWFRQAVLSGALEVPGYADAPEEFHAVRWITPRWDWVDPQKDLTAEKIAVDNGFKSRSDVVESMGYDVEETDARIAADKAREAALGLSFADAPPALPPDDEDEKEQNDNEEGPDG